MTLNKNHQVYIYILCIFSLIISSILGENSSGGSKLDYIITRQFVDNFSSDFNEGIDYFIKSGQVHSPFFYILISIIEKNLGQGFMKYLYLLISNFIPFIFYISLKKKFKNVDKKILFFISIVIFFSPYFRSSAIWITTDNLAIIFFILSISSFLSFKKKRNTKNLLLCIFYISISIYIRQYYIVFTIYYFYKFFEILTIKDILKLIFLLILIFIPFMFYYYHFLKANLNNYDLNSNPFEFTLIKNILIFLSLYFFYTIPFYLNNLVKIKNYVLTNFKKILFIGIIFILVHFYYTISFDNIGGGVFIKLSYFFDSKSIFFISCFIGTILIFMNLNKDNLIVYICLICAFPTIIIYQKYYDPLLILTIFTLTKDGMLNQIVTFNKVGLNYIYLYFTTFLIISNLYYRFSL